MRTFYDAIICFWKKLLMAGAKRCKRFSASSMSISPKGICFKAFAVSSLLKVTPKNRLICFYLA